MEANYNIVVVFAIHWHESTTGEHVSLSQTPLPPPSPSHPSGSSQCTGPERPVSCIESGLEICFTYDHIHVSVLFCQIIPPSPSPTESSLFYSVSFWNGDEDVLTPGTHSGDWVAASLVKLPEGSLITVPISLWQSSKVWCFLEGQMLTCCHCILTTTSRALLLYVVI